MYSPHRVVSTCLAILLFNASIPAFAQQSMPVETELTVQDAFESALSIDPEVRSALKRIEAFKARRSAASALTAEPLSIE